MRFMGENGIGIAVSMRKGGDIIALGKNLEQEFARLQKTLPLGMDLQKFQISRAVKRSINEFMKVLAEAVIIVLLVSFSRSVSVPVWWWRSRFHWYWR